MVKGTESVTVEDVVNHFDHVRDLVGIEHVGLGSDTGVESNDLGAPEILREMLAKGDPRYHIHGTHEVVAGLEEQKRVYDLTAAFIRRGYRRASSPDPGPEPVPGAGRNLAWLTLPWRPRSSNPL